MTTITITDENGTTTYTVVPEVATAPAEAEVAPEETTEAPAEIEAVEAE